jgi:hypothetical protein
MASPSFFKQTMLGAGASAGLILSSFAPSVQAEDKQSAPVVVAKQESLSQPTVEPESQVKPSTSPESAREAGSKLAESPRSIPVPPMPEDAPLKEAREIVAPKVKIPKFDPAKVPGGIDGLRYLGEQFMRRSNAVIVEAQAKAAAQIALHEVNAEQARKEAFKLREEAKQAGSEAKQAGSEAEQAGREAEQAGREAEQAGREAEQAGRSLEEIRAATRRSSDEIRAHLAKIAEHKAKKLAAESKK